MKHSSHVSGHVLALTAELVGRTSLDQRQAQSGSETNNKSLSSDKLNVYMPNLSIQNLEGGQTSSVYMWYN